MCITFIAKCMQTVFDFENRNPLSSAKASNLLRQFCNTRSMLCMLFDLLQIKKTARNNELLTSTGRHFAMLLIFKREWITD